MNARVCSILAVLACLAAVAAPALADQPNDPDFPNQWQFTGPDEGLPTWAPLARDPDNASGVNFTGAWKLGNVGRPDVLVAYIEGGVNYSSDNIKDALNNIYLNQGELPKPYGSDSYDANGDGHFDLRDYARDPRVNPPCPPGVAPFVSEEEGTTRGCVDGGRHQYLNAVTIAGRKTPYLSPEDLIVGLSNGRDEDHNGYVDDISGWNFDRNTNDPQSEDTSYGHAPGLISDIAGVANNGYGGVGECRSCRVVPIRQGAECLGRPDRWGESILYATDLGAKVVSSVVVSYAYSSFNQKAIDYAYRHGVALSLDSNDFDAMDHTDGMLFNHVIPGNSLDYDQDTTAGQQPLTTWFRARSSVTSYGTHNVFSGYGTSTSGATPFMASMLAMVASAGRNAGIELTPNEIKQVMMNASAPVVPQTQSPQTARQWPGNPLSTTDASHTAWSTQYGYGRPDIGKATAMIMAGRIPPTADLTKPRWFEYVDPRTTPRLPVEGSVAPSRIGSKGVHWTLEYALGADPADSAFTTVASGDGPVSGRLGTIDLTKVPSLFYSHPPGQTLQPDGAEQYTVSIRLRVLDGNGLKGEDRRSIGLRHDPDLVRLKSYGAEISGAPTYVSLEGHGKDLVFSDYDGVVHALRPGGGEVPGFPVRSQLLRKIDPTNPEGFDAPAYRDVEAFRDLREPISGIAVGDLDGDGSPEIVATGMTGRVYAWHADGSRVHGFPVSMDTPADQHAVPTPRGATPHTRDPQRGAWAAPTLAPLEGHGLDVLLPAWDGRVYAWRGDGTRVPGWPVEIKLPQADFARDGVDPAHYMRDPKLMYSVGVADVLGKGRPQVFVSSFECSGQSPATQDTVLGLAGVSNSSVAKAWLYGVWPDGNHHAGGAYLPNWPVAMPAFAFCYDQSIDFVGEGVMPPLFANIGGAGLKVVSAAVTGPVEALNGDGTLYKRMDMTCSAPACAANPPYRPTGDTHTLTLTGQGGFSDLLGTGHPQFVQSTTGVESILLALGDAGQASLPQVYEKAWDPSTGQTATPGLPQRQDGFPFYDAPLSADLGQVGARSVVEANDNYWIHAWGPTGVEAPGFPKYTGQWTGFVGTVGQPVAGGPQHLVYGTREGDVFDWRVKGDPAASDWPHYRGNAMNTGQYGVKSPSGSRARR